jgi:aspartyl-tRNA(Asn)/glutamyl-tRNA(Gln) amidotransferase subunit A
LSPTLDSIGPLTRSAADAAVVFAVLTDSAARTMAPSRGLRLGRPTSYFFDKLDEPVALCVEAAAATVQAAGVDIVPVDLPEAEEREAYFPVALPADLIATLGRERFLAGREMMDPVVGARGDRGLEVGAAEYLWSAAAAVPRAAFRAWMA